MSLKNWIKGKRKKKSKGRAVPTATGFGPGQGPIQAGQAVQLPQSAMVNQQYFTTSTAHVSYWGQSVLTPPVHWLTGEPIAVKLISDTAFKNRSHIYSTSDGRFEVIKFASAFVRLYENGAPISLKRRTKADFLRMRLMGEMPSLQVNDVVVHGKIEQFYDPVRAEVWWTWSDVDDVQQEGEIGNNDL